MMTTWNDSMYPSATPQGAFESLFSGATMKLGIVAAGVGVAFGVGMAMGNQSAPPPLPPAQESVLALADARTSTHDRVRKRLRAPNVDLAFHDSLRGHPTTEGASQTADVVEAPKKSATKRSREKASAPPVKALPKARAVAAKSERRVPERKRSAPVPEDQPIVREEGVDNLDDEVSASERKTERKDNMAHLRSALLKVLGDDTPVWNEDHTPPSLNSQRKAAQSIGDDDSAVKSEPSNKDAKLPRKKIAAKKTNVVKKEPAVTSAFVLQVASIADEARAQVVASELRRMKRRVRIVRANVGGKDVYRVQVTGFSSREAANVDKARLGRGFVVAAK